MGWLLAVGILLLLAVLPLGVSVLYGEQGPAARVVVGFLKLQVFPLKKKAKKQTPSQQQPKPQKPKKGPPENTVPKGGSWTDFLPLVEVGLDLLGDLRRKLRVDCLKLHLVMAGDDPCDLAVNYGRMNAAVAGLLARLEQFLVIKKQEVYLGCDFAGDKTLVAARLDVTIPLGRLVAMGLVYGLRALKTYRNIQKQQEGGANL